MIRSDPADHTIVKYTEGNPLLATNMMLAAMTLLQIVWLAAIWWLRASYNWPMLVGLGFYSLFCAVVTATASESRIARLRQLKEWLGSSEKRFAVLLFVALISFGGYYASVQRVWTFDEEQNFRASATIARQGFAYFFDHYADISWLAKQHPPLAPIMNGLFMRVVGVSLLSIRILSLAFSAATLVVTYLMGRELFGRETGVLAALLLVSFPLFFRVSSAGMTDVHVTFFFTLALLLAIRLTQSRSNRTAVAAGIVIGLGLITKYTMALVFPVLLVFIFVRREFRGIAWQLGITASVSLLILLAWLGYASEMGVLAAQQNYAASYIRPFWQDSSERLQWMMETLFTRLPSSIGLYNSPPILLGSILLIRRRHRLQNLLFVWGGVVSIPLLLVIPDHRYFMPIFPALAIIAAFGLNEHPRLTERTALLSLLLAAGSLYLFIDWYRAENLFALL